MQAIAVESLSVRFGDVRAVREVDLTVERGEVFGFLGPNGAGKSTVINVLLDFVRRSSGEVRVLGHDPEDDPRSVRRRVGVLPEATGFYERDTARDHLRFAVDLAGTDDDPETLLDRTGIAAAADRPVGEYSKGMRKRLGLAIALVGEPELLILDEPLGGLDPAGARILREVVRSEADRGAAVFFSSHIMSQVETVCDRVGIMNDGRLVEVGGVDDLRIGAGTQIGLTLDSPATRVLSEVRGLDGVESATADGPDLTVTCATPAAKGAVVTQVSQSADVIRDVRERPPSLEQVFWTLTEDDG